MSAAAAAAGAAAKSQQSVAGLMALNFATSVSIIWANKLAFQWGFAWTTSLTVLHFVATFLGLEVSSRLGLFAKKPMTSVREVAAVLPISLAFTGFVIFNNLSLKFNPVGTYQLMKVMTTPVIVLLQWLLHRTATPRLQLAALALVCAGVALATVTALEVHALGIAFGVLGILSTSLYQIWVKTEQTRLALDAPQLLYHQSWTSALLLTFVALLVDAPAMDAASAPVAVSAWLWVAVSSVLAFLVNLSIFLVIKRTSPVSYNVLGHGKLCVILTSGYLLFAEPCTPLNLLGVALAVAGIVWYTSIKLAQSGQPGQAAAVAKKAEVGAALETLAAKAASSTTRARGQ